jgi:hypothetical protein
MRKGKAWGLAWVLLALAAPAWARDEGGLVRLELTDGSTLLGAIVAEDEEALTVKTLAGLEVRVPRAAVTSLRATRSGEGGFGGGDPSGSRLLLAPTARPLQEGEGYFSDHYVLFPGATLGLTDSFSLGGGVSMVPALGLTDQAFYLAPRLAWTLSGKAALSTGALYTRAGGYQAAVAFGLGTFGSPDASLTVGLGLAATRDDEGEEEFDPQTGTWRFRPSRWEFRDAPIVLVGGNKRLSRRMALISENWLFLGQGFRLSRQPFGLGLRFFGDRLSADVGVILVGEVLESGFPIPWLSFSYHFPARGR